jgi:hypothetical protein
VRAIVEHAGTETVYRRLGRGPVVLVLSARAPAGLRPPASPEADALVQALAAHFRVIVPESVRQATGPRPERAAPAFSWWLRGVLDGLGIVRARFVADAALARDVLQFVEASPECAECLAVLEDDAGAARGPAPDAPLPTLRVAAGPGGIAEVLRFLALPGPTASPAPPPG